MTLYTYIASQGRKRIPAEDVEVDASGFATNLDSTVTDVQLLADSVDALALSGGGYSFAVVNGTAQTLSTTVTYYSTGSLVYNPDSIVSIDTSSGYDKYVINETGTYIVIFSSFLTVQNKNQVFQLVTYDYRKNGVVYEQRLIYVSESTINGGNPYVCQDLYAMNYHSLTQNDYFEVSHKKSTNTNFSGSVGSQRILFVKIA